MNWSPRAKRIKIGCQIFGEMTFGARTFGDFWSQTFGDLTIGEHKQ